MRGSHAHPKVTTTGVPPALPLGGDPLSHTPAQKACASGGLSPSGPAVGGRRGRSFQGIPPTGRVPGGSRAGSEMGPARWGRGGSPLGRDLGQPEGFQRTAGRARAAGYRVPPIFTSAPTSGPQPSALLARTSPWPPLSHHPVLSGLTPPPVPPPTLSPLSCISLALDMLWDPLGSACSPDHLPGQAPECGVPPGPRLSCCPIPRGHLGRGRHPAQPRPWAAFRGDSRRSQARGRGARC